MRLICRVRGIGVAVSVRTSTFSFNFLIFSLCATEALFLIDDQKPQIFKDNILRKDAVRSDHDVHLPFFQIFQRFFCSPAVRKRDSISTRTGKSFILCTKVL